MESGKFQQHLAELVNHEESVSGFAADMFHHLLADKELIRSALVLFDPEKGILSYPFSTLEGHSSLAESLQSSNTPLRFVIGKEAPFLVEGNDYINYCHDSEAVTSVPAIWSGIPLFKDSQLYAVLVMVTDDTESMAHVEEQHNFLSEFAPTLSNYLITKMKLETLESSEVKFRRFVETSIDITFQITKGGYIDYVSSNINELFGCSSQDLIGKHFKVTTPMDQVSKVIEALKIISSGETVRNLNITQKVANGDHIPMEVSASPIVREGEIIGAQGTMRDISERQHAQQEIERLAFFPLINPMPVVEVDLYGVPSYINPAGIQLLDRMNLDMAQVNQILPKRFKHDIREALSHQTPIPSREVNLEGITLLWSGFFLSNQNLLHYYATDITSLKNTEKELISAKESAVKNEQVKTLFLANMSHEIRTPLNSILGFTELIEAEVKAKMDDELQTYFEIIHVSGKRLWQTVHEILDISQIETGTFELKIEEIDLGKILRELGANYRSDAEEKNLDLLVNVPTTELKIPGDAYCATQAISNLMDNAIKYTNEGYVKVVTAVHSDRIDVVIKDTGIGMSQEYQERMFNAFSQESTGYTKRFQGVGLGLALAQRYLEMINASIELESVQDSGSTFIIHFPTRARTEAEEHLAPIQSEEQRVPSETQDTNGDRLALLVVEDDPNSQKLAGFTLKKDFDLHFAESVAEAKQQLALHHINLVLLDLSLKGDEDGLDLARFVRQDEAWQKMPIIALTAHAFTSDRDRCMEAGCDDFMTKPFRRAELLETINRILTTEVVEN